MFVGIVFLVAKAQTRPKAMGLAALVDQPARILSWQDNRGTIQVRGEQWNARTKVPTEFHPGDNVRIARADGLIVDIEKQPATPHKTT
jgi:membrane-bound ClpP family serine protease